MEPYLETALEFMDDAQAVLKKIKDLAEQKLDDLDDAEDSGAGPSEVCREASSSLDAMGRHAKYASECIDLAVLELKRQREKRVEVHTAIEKVSTAVADLKYNFCDDAA